MKRYSSYQVIVVCFCLLRIGSSDDYTHGEPHCFSRFDYEYKVLQKLIQLEEAHKELAEAIKARDVEIEEQTSEIKVLKDFVNMTHPYKSDLKGPVVAFSAFIDADTPVGAKTIFNKVLINEPAAYDKSTGVFTCPVEGIYLFSYVIAVRNEATSYGKLTINENVVLEAVAEGTQTRDDKQGSNVAIVKLEKDDKVWVSGSGTLPGNSNGTSNTRTSSFSGVLLHRANA